jgi:hypothetical protein
MLKERNMLELLKMSGSRQSISKVGDKPNGSVLISKQSQLVSIMVNEIDTLNLIVTVDSENLLRCWSMKDCHQAFSYKIPMQ